MEGKGNSSSGRSLKTIAGYNFKRIPSTISGPAKVFSGITAVIFITAMMIYSKVTVNNTRIKEISGNADKFTQLQVSKTAIMKEFSDKEQEIADYKNSEETVITKDSLILYLNEACIETNCELLAMAGNTTTKLTDVLNEITFRIEVGGTLAEIEEFSKKIENLNTNYSINELSLKKSDKFSWLTRDKTSNDGSSWFDSTFLGEEVVENEDEYKIEEIGLKDIYGTDKLSLYLDISFLSVVTE